MTPHYKLACVCACVVSIGLTLFYFNLADEVGWWGDERQFSDKELDRVMAV